MARVFAVHLTRPSGSEAKVVSGLLRYLDKDLKVLLATNARGSDDPGSYFREIEHEQHNVVQRAVEVGVPSDPQAPRHVFFRGLSRIARRLRRGRLLELARGYKPDIVYTSQQVFDCQVGEWIASKLGLPHAVHLHYTIGPWLRAQPLQRLKSCDLLFCVSHFIAEQARSHGVNPDRIVVLHNTLGESELAAKPRVFTSVDPGSVTIGQVGRMAPGKGFSDTLSAFCQLRSRLPSVKLVLVGDGPERPQLEAFARKHELDSSSVRFTGWRSDIRALLSQMDVFVFPSRNEPFGMALLEACAAGVPAIAYREGGVPEIIVDQESGLLVPPGDLEALANAMLDLCQDPEKRERLSRGAQERARTAFSPRAAAAAFSAGLRRLAKEGSDNSIA